ncbi:MAG: AI-2E family transporter [Nitrosospira sp.]|nr:AI-2E family transporter [Nitrosospira sp.]
MNASPTDESANRLKASPPDVVVRTVTDETISSDTSPTFGIAKAVWILALIALVAALYLARTFFVPLLFGILVSYALHPLVDWFERFRVPRALSAALVLAALVGGGSWIAFSLSGDAAEMVEQLPDTARKLRQHLDILRATTATPLHHVQEAASELEAVTDAGLKPDPGHANATKESEPTVSFRNFVLAQAALLVAFTAQAPVVLLLTYFLLASGTHFRRKLVQFAGSSLTSKKDIVRILEEVEGQIQRYLLVTLISNSTVGVATWLAFTMLGLEHAGVLGVAAGVLRFIPYLGTVAIALAATVAGLLQFGSLPQALLVPAVFLLISGLVGMVFTTWLLGRAARVNTAVLFIALLFFAWLWGIPGLLLGAPLLAIFKVICDRVDFLKPVGELLGR